MKISKKLVSLILCIVLLGTLAITGFAYNDSSVPALDKTGPYIDFSSEAVKPGEIAEVTAVIGNNPGIWGIKFTLDYGDTLTPVIESVTEQGSFPKATCGTDFKNTNGYGDNKGFDNIVVGPVNDGKFTYVYTEFQAVFNKKNGELVTFYFNVPDNAAPGEYTIDIVDYSEDDFIDPNKKTVAMTFGQAKVTVVTDDEPSSSEPSSSEPSSSESSSSEPSSSEPSSSEPSSSEPSSSEPSSSEPSSSEPSSSEPSSSEPSSSEPSSSEPSSSEPSSSEPSSSEPSSSEPSSSSEASTDPGIDDPFDNTSTSSNPSASTSTTQPSNSGKIGIPVITVKQIGTTSVRISWKAVANAKSYQIFRAKNNSNSYVRIATLSGAASYTDKTAKGAAKYKYKVRAVNGNKYAESSVKIVSVMNYKAKAKIKVTSESKSATVKITKKLSYAKGYQIAYSTSSKFNKKLTKTKTISASKKSVKLTKLNAGKKYYVRVRAYQIINGRKKYGKWTKVAKVTIKK